MSSILTMPLSQTIYQIELLFPLKLYSDKDQFDTEPKFIKLCELDCDPCIPIGEEINVPEWKLGRRDGGIYSEKTYSFNTKVVGIKREVHPHSGESKGTFLVRYFVEAEDRDLVIEMCNLIENNNLR